ncbi:MAG: hypothetical protein JXR77_18175 [Lentisphaeria bacterium]|nr:hypothetical protein [Lentisphaeria bacterium]
MSPLLADYVPAPPRQVDAVLLLAGVLLPVLAGVAVLWTARRLRRSPDRRSLAPRPERLVAELEAVRTAMDALAPDADLPLAAGPSHADRIHALLAVLEPHTRAEEADAEVGTLAPGTQTGAHPPAPIHSAREAILAAMADCDRRRFARTCSAAELHGLVDRALAAVRAWGDRPAASSREPIPGEPDG